MKILLTGASGFIGTNLVDMLVEKKHTIILNIDCNPPFKKEHNQFWRKCDLLDFSDVEEVIKEFQPEMCIHLAAETEIKESKDWKNSYPVNIIGSRNLFQLLKKYSIKKSIIVSTQFVCGPSEDLPKKHDDYWPHTDYGRSKVEMEHNARKILEPGTFIVARPTYVWGPWHFKNFADLVRTIKSRHYIHPSGINVIRSYGYVKNVCFQLMHLLVADKVTDDWFYVGDRPIDSYEFVNGLSKAIIGKNVHSLPKILIFFLGKIGDLLQPVLSIPINSFRYKNMTTSYSTPMEEIFALVGEPPYTLGESIEDFFEWYKVHTY